MSIVSNSQYEATVQAAVNNGRAFSVAADWVADRDARAVATPGTDVVRYALEVCRIHSSRR